VERYQTERASLIATGVPGLGSARLLASLTDEALRRLSVASPHPPPHSWALIALGGYGAGALLPTSDIDVLLLSEAPAELLKPFFESMLYPLWDAGLDVGHQVRSPKQHLAASRNDLTVLAATLTGRVVCGDADYGRALLERCCSDAHRRSRRVLPALAGRERPGSPYLLEPDLKNGAGGRRDYDELAWTAAVLAGRPQATPSLLVDAGLLSEGEKELAETASAVTAEARWELGVAGHGSRLKLHAVDSLTTDPQSVQTAVADTAHVLDRVRRRIAGTDIETTLAAEGSGPLSAKEVFAVLRLGEEGVAPLEEAAWLGRLDPLLPGFKTLLPLRRPALAHSLTVGAHSITCAAIAASFSALGHTLLERSRGAIADDRPLLVAALAHDRGKIEAGPGHAERGADTAADCARRFGLGAQAQVDVAELVRLHLLLVDGAIHDDLDSEDAILSIAERIGRRDLVPSLHVLAVADALSTGPAAWGSWLEALVSTLVSRVDAALSPEVDGAGLAKRGEEIRLVVLSALPNETPCPAVEFVERAPLRYLASREPAQVVKHARLVAELEAQQGPQVARLSVGPSASTGAFEVAVVAHDRPELLARIAGALTLAGLDILGVDAYTTAAHIALDVFTVRSATLAAVEHETWQRAERYLHAALADRLELEARLAERRRHYANPRVHVNTHVCIDTSAGFDTAVVVTAPDRVGLLYDIARAIASVGLEIRWAKALTVDGVAKDTFHVVGPDGQAPTDAGILGHVAMRIRERA